MNSITEKEKKLSLVLTELKKLNLKNPELQSSIENLNQKKNQLEIEKKGLEDNYQLLKEDLQQQRFLKRSGKIGKPHFQKLYTYFF